MAPSQPTEYALKQAMKEAFVEALSDQRELLYEVFTEVLEDFALAEAIRQGQGTEPDDRAAVFRVLQGE